MTTTYEIHPAAEIFPLLEGKEFDDLVADIKAHGLREPIVLHEGKILDGRNRYRACQLAGALILTLERTDIGDPYDFVLSANLHRRHLTVSQRAMILATIPARPQGYWRARRDGTTGEIEKTDGYPAVLRTKDLAASGGVSKDTLKGARQIRKNAPDLVPLVEQGEMTVNVAVGEIQRRKQGEHRGKKEPLREVDQHRPSPRMAELLAKFGDGKYHMLTKIIKQWGDGKDASHTLSALRTLQQRGHIRYEKRYTGEETEYRFFAVHDTALIPVSEIREKLMPFLDILRREGIREVGFASQTRLVEAAHRICQQLDVWGAQIGSGHWHPGNPPPEEKAGVEAADRALVGFKPAPSPRGDLLPNGHL